MCVYIQEAIYDEDAVIAIVDSDNVLTMVQKHLDLSIKYQDALDVFLSLDSSTQDDMNKVNEISKELATYRKALQITLPNSVKIV
jgi:NH3-dependent NAD+ synthetase